MTRKVLTTIGAVSVLAAVGAGAATAARYTPPAPGYGHRADCPVATTKTPLRIHAQDGTGQNARPGAPLEARDGTGPHGPWHAGR
jgi:hypothetical protein